MSEAPAPGDLSRLAARTRELVLDLEATRADVLSVADLNRAMRQVLRNQVAIIEALAASQARQPDGVFGGELASRSQAPRPDGAQVPPPGAASVTQAAPVTQAAAVTQALPRPEASAAHARQPEGAGASGASGAQARRAAEPLVFEPHADEPAVPALNGTNGAARLEPAQASPLAGDDAPASAAGADSLAEQVLREGRVLPVHIARSVVEAFDNRDKNYDKGLEKLNRWVAGGAGTPFQWRGDRAYLNLNGAGAAAVKNYEEQLMSRMGFSRRLGRLVVPGLQGEVIIYERPG